MQLQKGQDLTEENSGKQNMAMGHFVAFQNHRLTGLIPAGFSDSNKEEMRKRSSRKIWENVIRDLQHRDTFPLLPGQGSQVARLRPKKKIITGLNNPRRALKLSVTGRGWGTSSPRSSTLPNNSHPGEFTESITPQSHL